MPHYANSDWNLLDLHLFNTFCGGNEEKYVYLLNWFSHLFSSPTENPSVALRFSGKHGKSVFFDALVASMKPYAVKVTSPKQLNELSSSLLGVVEESTAENPVVASIAKTLIQEHLVMEKVDGRCYEYGVIESPCRVIFLAGESCNSESHDESIVEFNLTDWSAKQNLASGDFFSRLIAEMSNGGLLAFARDVAARKATLVDLRNIPV